MDLGPVDADLGAGDQAGPGMVLFMAREGEQNLHRAGSRGRAGRVPLLRHPSV